MGTAILLQTGTARSSRREFPRPFLKWVGGKSQLLPELRKLYPQRFGTYFEPFLGGGAVFFDLQPAKAVLNDANSALVSAYINIKNHPMEVAALLQQLHDRYQASDPAGRESLYYQIRTEYNDLKAELSEKTAYLIFLNKTGFNGLYRESSKGHFNVPFGKCQNPRILDEPNLEAVSGVLQRARLTSMPFEDSVAEARRGDFIYFDPPYHPLTATSSFTSYHSLDFCEDEQRRLRDRFVRLHKKGCLVMLSNSYTPFIRELYQDFQQHVVMASRAVNCKADGRGKIKELVVTNFMP